MALLKPPEGPTTRRPAGQRSDTGGPESGPAEPARRILLVSRDEQLDSLLALRRVAAHLGDLRPVSDTSPHTPPDVALVCDDEAATGRLLASGVPVVHLRSGHDSTADAADATGPTGAAARALHRVHRPGWLPAPEPTSTRPRPTGVLAPARTTRRRAREGTLVLLSAWGVPADEADAFSHRTLRPLVHEALRRTGRCEVVGDTRLAAIRGALASFADVREVRVSRAADVDVDALHADAEVFVAAPTLGAVTLAQVRRAPLVLLPALGAAQHDLAARVREVVPVRSAADPADDRMWTVPEEDGAGPWAGLDADLDDLRGAQRVARTLRQLSLAPL